MIYTRDIIFLTRDEITDTLVNNHSFYSTFYEKDFQARRISTIEDYQNIIIKSCRNFTLFEKLKLTMSIHYANQRLCKIKEKWFDGEKASRIEWKIGCFTGMKYENGYPHTVDDTIVLPKEIVNTYTLKELTDTMMHEKTHIYQKLFQDDISHYIAAKGFEKIKKREPSDNIRANPDIDNIVYRHRPTDNIYRMRYSDYPSNIAHTIDQNLNQEHPYEEMAMIIEER
jgi:hypothetical protein